MARSELAPSAALQQLQLGVLSGVGVFASLAALRKVLDGFGDFATECGSKSVPKAGNSPLWRHLRAIMTLPFNVTVTLPLLMSRSSACAGARPLFGLRPTQAPGLFLGLLGSLSGAAGLSLFVWTNRLFHKAEGTLAPWDPPRKLVVSGPYCYVRNPMLSGVNLVLCAEGLLFGQWSVLGLVLSFLTINTAYFVGKEEPELRERFGEEYQEYSRHVGRWLPRLTPWEPGAK